MELVYISSILAQLLAGGVFGVLWASDRDERHNGWWALAQALLALSLGAGWFVTLLPLHTPMYWAAAVLTGAALFGSGVAGLAGAWTWLGRQLRVRDALLLWAASLAVLVLATSLGRHAGNVTGTGVFGAMLIASGVALARSPGAARVVGVLFVVRGGHVLSIPWAFDRIFSAESVSAGLPAYMATALGLLVISFRRKSDALRQRNGALELMNTLAALARDSRSTGELTQRAAHAVARATTAPVVLVLRARPGDGQWHIAGTSGLPEAAAQVARVTCWAGWPGAGAGAAGVTLARTGLPGALQDALQLQGVTWLRPLACRVVEGDPAVALVLGFGTRQALRQADASTLDSVGQVLGLLVADRLRVEDIEYRATHDELTALANRTSMQRELALRLAAAGERRCALLLIDLDDFKSTNDALGHHVGDDVLRTVAARLREVTPPGACVGRLGGDEFAIVLGERCPDEALALAQRVLQEVRLPITVGAVQLRVGCSIGVAHATPHLREVSEMMRAADMAMFRAKSASLGLSEFDATLDAGRSDKLELLAGLQRALEGDELELYYQPQVALDDGRIVGWEALLRWHHPQLGLILPGRFLPAVEASDLIHPLTRWVAASAIAQARQWLSQGVPGRVAINLSARNLFDTQWPQLLQQLLQHHELPPQQLEVEITETALVQDTVTVQELLRAMKAIGVRLAVDDYGEGYSSMSYLKRFPIDVLKIDRSFIADLAHNGQDAVIVRSTIALAHDLGLEVMAEGVEDEATRALVAHMHCDNAQGYLFARPMPAPAVRDWLRARVGAAEPVSGMGP